MSGARVTAVIVTYRSRETIPHVLEEARRSHEKGLLDCVVVDNDGGDGTAQYVREREPWVEVVSSGANLGFGRGCNLGVERVESEYVLFVNPDAVLPSEDLETLVRFLDRTPRAGIVGPAIREPDGALQEAGGLLTPWRMILEVLGAGDRLGRRPIVPGEPPFRTDWLCGAIWLVRKRVLDELGGFDPRFFLYFEETDLCRRAARAGWELWACGEAVGRHRNAASADPSDHLMHFGCIAEHFFRSRFHYLVKHFGWMRASAAELVELVVIAARCAARRAVGRPLGEFAARLHAPVLQLPAEPPR